MKAKTKMLECEMVAQEIFGDSFVNLAEACTVFGKVLSGKEINCFKFFCAKAELLKECAKEGFCLLPFLPISIKDVRLAAPKLFFLNLTDFEKYALDKELMKPGWYLVRKQPRRLSFGDMQMRESGIFSEQNPRVAEVMYAFALCYLLGKRRLLLEQFCVLCRDEIIRRGEKAQVCFRTNRDNGIDIEAWRSQMPASSVLPIKRA